MSQPELPVSTLERLEDYHSWSNEIITWLGLNGLLGHILDDHPIFKTKPYPEETGNETPGSAAHAELENRREAWSTDDQRAKDFITNHISAQGELPYPMCEADEDQTAREAWERIEADMAWLGQRGYSMALEDFFGTTLGQADGHIHEYIRVFKERLSQLTFAARGSLPLYPKGTQLADLMPGKIAVAARFVDGTAAYAALEGWHRQVTQDYRYDDFETMVAKLVDFDRDNELEGQADDALRVCSHCGKRFHTAFRCFKKHPELRPRGARSPRGSRGPRSASRRRR